MHGEGMRVEEYNGNTVYILLADYQDVGASHGDGWLRIMDFSPANDVITVTTYSTTLEDYGTDDTMGADTTSAPFTLAYDMGVTDPTIIVYGVPLPVFSSQPGVPSAEQSYTVSGINLTGDIVITAPTDFEISTTSGGGFGSSLTLLQSDGSVAATPIYVRFNRATEGTSGGDITHASAGATTQNIAVSGEASTAPTTVTFRQGDDGYSGTVDTFIMEDEPGAAHGTLESVEWDARDPQSSTPPREKLALIRFDGIFGAGQIPPGATIQSATLTYYVYNTGDSANVNQVVIDWSEDVTYNGFGGDPGVQTDEYGASVGSAGGATGAQSIDVTASLVAWAGDPSSNQGWIFWPTGEDGVDFRSSEYGIIDQRPLLTVEYNSPTAVTLASFTATWGEDEVLAAWETAAEINTVGFNLWRSETRDGGYVQVNDALIPAASLGGVWGGFYIYTDSDVTPGTTYYYKLNELETGGASNWYGPVSTTDGEDAPTSVILFRATIEKSGSRALVLWLGAAALIIGVGLATLTRRPCDVLRTVQR
jgi:hypothetical protein